MKIGWFGGTVEFTKIHDPIANPMLWFASGELLMES
jgi:hypothetical protein